VGELPSSPGAWTTTGSAGDFLQGPVFERGQTISCTRMYQGLAWRCPIQACQMAGHACIEGSSLQLCIVLVTGAQSLRPHLFNHWWICDMLCLWRSQNSRLLTGCMIATLSLIDALTPDIPGRRIAFVLVPPRVAGYAMMPESYSITDEFVPLQVS
jgi:hypothetical protein